MLRAQCITKFYQEQKVIENISLEVREGELVCLLGASGIGKTTLFQILSGLEHPDQGQVYLNDQMITGMPGKMSYMQQKDLLLPFETILSNVSMPLTLSGISKKIAREKALSHFPEFGIDGCQQKYPAQLSGGMRQRAALLRSYLFSSHLMLLDEPFSALDVITKTSMHRWFLQVMKNHNTTALLITHDIDEAILLADRIYIMAGVPGRIVAKIAVSGDKKADPDFSVSQQFIEYKKQILKLV